MYALTDAISELLGVQVSEHNVNAMLRCPLHDDNSPSFSIHLDEGVWHCFGCEESGTLKGLYRRLGEEVSPDVRLAQAKKSAEAPEIFSRDFSRKAREDYYRLQDGIRRKESRGGRRQVYEFISSRNIRQAAIRKFGIGWDAEKSALTFPYVDGQRRVTGIKYRHLDGFKTSETGSRYGLYALDNLVGMNKVIICEGESDTLAVWSKYGEKYGVGGTSGASISAEQWNSFSAHLIFASKIYLLHDADEAGDRCAETAISVIGDKCVRIRTPDGTDASEYLSSGGILEELGLG